MDPLLKYFDVIKYLEQYGHDYTTTGKNVTRGWVEIQSPYVHDHSMHLGINLNSKVFSCWLSGEKGPITKLIRKLEGCGESQVKKILEEFTDYTLALPDELKTRQKTGSKIVPKNFLQLTTENVPIIVSSYLDKRGYGLNTAITYDCYYQDPINRGDWKFRLMIPVYQQFELCTFVGRDLTGEAEIRYKNFPEEKSILPAKNCIYGIDDVSEGQDILIVEGIFDKWRLSLSGIPNVVATSGTMTTEAQHTLLRKKRPKKIWILFDRNAEVHARTLASYLPFCPTEILMSDSHKDPDLYNSEEIQELREVLNG